MNTVHNETKITPAQTEVTVAHVTKVESSSSNGCGGCGCGRISKCLCGGISIDVGPCICNTSGNGLLGCLGCCVLWPINCFIGSTWGICNYITCGSCSR